MSRLRSWLNALPGSTYVPLFATRGDVVETRTSSSGRRYLCRSPAMERAIIDLVARGLADPEWTGMLYVMAWGPRDRLLPLYVGVAGRYGRTPGRLSVNFQGVDRGRNRNKFARWGDGNAYHIGDLSQALFGWEASECPDQKYRTWAATLFIERDPPRLRETTYLLVAPWREGQRGLHGDPCTPQEAETQAIEVAIEEFEDVVLNVQGETWWAPAAREPAVLRSMPAPEGDRVQLITTPTALVQLARDLAHEKVIGLDVETTLYTQRLCLVQIAKRGGQGPAVFLIDAVELRSLDALREILGPSGPTKVIHNASFERRILGEAGIELAGDVFDTLRRSRDRGPPNVSHRLEAVCARLLGRSLDKSAQRSDWSVRPLTSDQLRYAALDAEVLLELFDVLSKGPRNGELFK